MPRWSHHGDEAMALYLRLSTESVALDDQPLDLRVGGQEGKGRFRVDGLDLLTFACAL
jgi:hypothetical protein